VLGPLNNLVWLVPSLRYTRGLGWRMHCGVEVTESSTNKQHHHHEDNVEWILVPELKRSSARWILFFISGTNESRVE
jgi:hypothetical protein